MRVGIPGSGLMGGKLGTVFARAGHEVVFSYARSERKLKRLEWEVYAKPPFGGPDHVLDYLGRYTHRVAISNDRLVSLEDGKVTFRWKDYKAGNKQKRMTLDAEEFIWRFLLHVLPGGFVRIRHFGWLANAHRRHKLALCRELLGVHQSEEHQEVSILAANPRFWHDLRRTGSVANADNDARRIQELQVKGRFLDQVIGTMRKFRVRRIILV